MKMDPVIMRPAAITSKEPTRCSDSILIIGNGPSTTRLSEFGFHHLPASIDTFGMGAAYRFFSRINWWPDYYAWVDAKVVHSHKSAFQRLIEDQQVSTRAFYFSLPISENPRFHHVPHGSTGDFCFRKAVELGYRNIYLLGIEGDYVEELPESRPLSDQEYEDLGYAGLFPLFENVLPDKEKSFALFRDNLRIISKTPEHNPNYFFEGYQRAGDVFSLPRAFTHRNAWRKSADFAAKHNVNVVNLSETSKIEHFRKASWDDFSSLLRDQTPTPVEPFSPYGRPIETPTALSGDERRAALAEAGLSPQQKLATLIIGVRFPHDDPSRVRNLLILLDWIHHYYGDLFDVLLMEQDSVSRIDVLAGRLRPYVRHAFAYNPNAFNRGWGYNVAVRHHTEAKVVAMLDTDVLTGANFLREIIDCHSKYEAISPYTNVYFTEPAEAARTSLLFDLSHLRCAENIAKPTTLCGGIVILRRETFLDVVGFEQYIEYAGEDRALDVTLLNHCSPAAVRLAPYTYVHLHHPKLTVDVRPRWKELFKHLKDEFGCKHDPSLGPIDDIHRTCQHVTPAKTRENSEKRRRAFGDPDLYRSGRPLTINGCYSDIDLSNPRQLIFPPAFKGLESYGEREFYQAPEPDTARLAKLYNKHKGQRCFIIGNGPSLNKHDLSLLRDEHSFAVNSFYYKTAETGFRPTFFVVEDDAVMRENIEQIRAYEAPFKFFPTNYKALHPAGPNVFFFRVNRGFYEKSSPNYCVPRFSTDASQVLYCGQSVTYINLQLAFFLGFTEVYLIGMDFDYVVPPEHGRKGDLIYSTTDDPNHFHKDYFGKGKTWKDPKLDRVAANYRQAKLAYESVGRSIYNATIGGKLEIFERVDYDALLKRGVKQNPASAKSLPPIALSRGSEPAASASPTAQPAASARTPPLHAAEAVASKSHNGAPPIEPKLAAQAAIVNASATAPAPARAAANPPGPPAASLATPDSASNANAHAATSTEASGMPQTRFGAWLAARSPSLFGLLRMGGRALAGMWRRRTVTLPAAILLATLPIVAFLPGFEIQRPWLLGAGAFLIAMATIVYVALRLYEFVFASVADARRMIERLDALQASNTQLEAKFNSRLRALENSSSKLHASVQGGLNAVNATLSRQVADINTRAAALKQDVDRRLDGLDHKLEGRDATLRNDFLASLATAKSEAQSRFDSLLHDIGELVERLQALDTEMARRENHLRGEFTTSLDALAGAADELGSSLRAELTAQMWRTDDKLDALAAAFESGDAALRQDLAAQARDASEQLAMLNASAEALRTELQAYAQSTREQFTSVDTSREAGDAALRAELMAQVQRTNEQLALLKSSAEAGDAALRYELSSQNQKALEQIARLESGAEARETALRTEISMQAERIREQLAIFNASVEAGDAALRSELKAHAQQAQEQLDSLKAGAETGDAALRAELAAQTAHAQKELASLAAAAQASEAAIRWTIETGADALRDESSRARQSLEAELKAEMERRERSALDAIKREFVRGRGAKLRERVATTERQIGSIRYPDAARTLVFFGHHKCASRFFREEVFTVAAEAAGARVRRYQIKEPPFHYSMSDELDLVNIDFSKLGENGRDVVMFSNATRRCLDRLDRATKQWRGVRILRDPRQVLVSNYFHHKGDHPSAAQGWVWDLLAKDKPILQDLPEEEGLLYELDSISKQIIETQLLADFADPRILTIKIEDFSTDPKGHLDKISEFLGVATIAGLDFNRTGANPNSGPWRRHFTSKLRAVFKERYGQALIDLGYAEDLHW